jgi:multiple sugar transport system ATP-binding protein
MDEPLSNLDAKLRVETRANIAALQARLGTTTIYVTHDQVEAMTMGHRVAVLKDGLLQQADTPRSLYDRPSNVFVAGFIGSPAMNLKTVTLVDGGAKLGGLVVPLRRDTVAAAAAAGLSQITLGIRPEAFSVATDGQPGLDLRVDIAEELGADAYVYGTATLDSGDEQFVVRVDGRHVPHMGETVRLTVAEGSEHAFHPETGERLGD